MSAYARRGFTFGEIAVVIGIVLAAALVAIVLFNGHYNEKMTSRQVKDAAQVREIQRAMAVWANQNGGQYPLPSEIDLLNTTIDAVATSKDTTANICSILIFGGYVSAETLISPAEVNANIRACNSYEIDRPTGAAKPDRAVWDPSFSADFTSRSGGNLSYAHLQPAGERRKLWRDDFSTTLPIACNRGPQIAEVVYETSADMPQFVFTNPKSNTLRMHVANDTWEGNIVYNDGHVAFGPDIAPGTIKLISVHGRTVRDVLFFDETAPAAMQNAFLGIFIKSGDSPADFTAIWD